MKPGYRCPVCGAASDAPFTCAGAPPYVDAHEPTPAQWWGF